MAGGSAIIVSSGVRFDTTAVTVGGRKVPDTGGGVRTAKSVPPSAEMNGAPLEQPRGHGLSKHRGPACPLLELQVERKTYGRYDQRKWLGNANTNAVEVRGIEPLSLSDLLGLLRA
jgi:hypothetical protein